MAYQQRRAKGQVLRANCLLNLDLQSGQEFESIRSSLRPRPQGLGGRGEKMTKADLIDEVSRLAELTRRDSEVIVETIFESVVRSLRAGDKIEIRGFGSFRTRQRKPRVGRNPKTGDRVEVPAKKIPYFKPSKELKDLVNTFHEAQAATPATPSTAPEGGVQG